MIAFAKTLILTLIITSNFAFANTPVLGAWGGESASLWATPNGADAELHCSFARIAEPLMMDANGRFMASGFVDYFDGTPPIKKLAATFAGNVVEVEIEDEDDYRQMNLTVNLSNGRTWKFELREDEIGTTEECRR